MKDLSSIMLTALLHSLSSLHTVSLLSLHYCQGSQQLVETRHPGKPCPVFTFWPVSLCWNGRNYNRGDFRHCPGWLLCTSHSLEIHPGAVSVRSLMHANGFPSESSTRSFNIELSVQGWIPSRLRMWLYITGISFWLTWAMGICWVTPAFLTQSLHVLHCLCWVGNTDRYSAQENT